MLTYSEDPLDVPARHKHPYFPQIVKCTNHPQLSGSPGVKRVFAMAVDTSPSAMKNVRELAKSGVPEGEPEDWDREGWVCAEPGDTFFVRDPNAELGPEDDVLAASIVDPGIYKPEDLEAFKSAVTNLVGNFTKGKTALEDTGRAKKTQGARCYQTASTFQKTKRLFAPAQPGKGQGEQDGIEVPEEWNEYQDIINDLIKTASTLAATASDTLPGEVKVVLTQYHDLINFPSVGVAKNKIWGQVQINISDTKGRSILQLGARFGSAHRDECDHPAVPSWQIPYLNIPTGWRGGYFFLPELGIYWKMESYVAAFFSGLRLHCSRPPYAPNGEMESDPDGIRVNLVFFNTSGAIDGKTVYSMASKPIKPPVLDDVKKTKTPKKGGSDRGPLVISSEITNVLDNGFVPRSCTQSTYASDGGVIMDAETQLNYVGRSIVQLSDYIMRQIHPSRQVELDSNAILNAITYVDESGQRRSLNEWKHAPNVLRPPQIRAQTRKAFDKLSDRMSRFIPAIAQGPTPRANGDPRPNTSPSETKQHQERASSKKRPPVKQGDGEMQDGDGDATEDEGEEGQGANPPSLNDVVDAGTGQNINGENGQAGDVEVSDDDADVNADEEDETDETYEDATISARKRAGTKRARDGRSRSENTATKRKRTQEQTKPTAHAFRFLQDLSEDLLASELRGLREERRAYDLEESRGLSTELQGFDDLVKYASDLQSTPCSTNALENAKKLQTQSMLASSALHSTEYVTRRTRQQVILWEVMPWIWSEVQVVETARERMSGVARGGRERDWLDDLIEITQEGIFSRLPRITYSPGAYPSLKALSSTAFDFVNQHTKRRYIRSNKADQEAVEDIVINIIRELVPAQAGIASLSPKQDGARKLHALVVDMVVRALGPEFLCTDIAWKHLSGKFFQTWDFATNRWARALRCPPHSILDNFKHEFERHPILQRGSTERNLYEQIMQNLPTAASRFFPISQIDRSRA